jgi:hypothetical protein
MMGEVLCSFFFANRNAQCADAAAVVRWKKRKERKERKRERKKRRRKEGRERERKKVTLRCGGCGLLAFEKKRAVIRFPTPLSSLYKMVCPGAKYLVCPGAK